MINLVSVLFPGARADGDPMDDRLFTPTGVMERKTVSGEKVSESSAMTLSSYFACVRVISEDIGKLPLKIFRELPRGKEVASTHPSYRLIHDRANPEMSSMSFWETIVQWAMTWGNGFAEIVFNAAGAAVAMYPIHPSRVKMKRRSDGSCFYRVSADLSLDGKRYEYVDMQPWQMLHIKGLGDGMMGYSVLRFASESIGLGLAAQSFGASFFGNGTTLSGVLEHPGKLGESAAKNLRESWAQMHGGAKKAHKPGVLEEGMKWHALSVPPEEAQFLQTREFQNPEICRWFRVQPHKIHDLSRSTFSNIEAQNTEYVVDTLTPWAKRIEQEVEFKILHAEAGLRAEIVFLGLLRGDSNARANFYRTMVNIGSMTPNEVRELEGINPGSAALDDSYMQSNMLPLSKIGQQTARDQPPMPRQSEPTDDQAESRLQLAAQAEAMKPVFVEAADRVLHREAAAVPKAGAKFKDNAAAFARWCDEFYKDQATYVERAFAPAVASLDVIQANILSIPLVEANLAAYASTYADACKQGALASKGQTPHPNNTPWALADDVMALVLGTPHA